MLTLIVLLLLAAAGAGAYYMWSRQRDTSSASSADDRYDTKEAISPAHIQLLMYLQSAFPGRVVLFRPELPSLVSVRHAADRQRALQRLQDVAVDYVVCAKDGRAEYAFDVRERNGETDKTVQRVNALKSRVLKTAGVPLLRIHRSVHNLPPVSEFQSRLAESLGLAQPSTQRTFPAAHAHEVPPSNLAGLTDLMGLPPENASDTQPPR